MRKQLITVSVVGVLAAVGIVVGPRLSAQSAAAAPKKTFAAYSGRTSRFQRDVRRGDDDAAPAAGKIRKSSGTDQRRSGRVGAVTERRTPARQGRTSGRSSLKR